MIIKKRLQLESGGDMGGLKVKVYISDRTDGGKGEGKLYKYFN